ncbi:MAG: M48 family metallopeptidase [Planctomycetota bacterium]
MSTQFFDRQAAARRNTVWLIAMFIVALIVMVAVIFVVVSVGSKQILKHQSPLAQARVTSGTFEGQNLINGLFGAAFTAVLICSGTAYKVLALRQGGGGGVAESIGGKRIAPDSASADEQRVLNVVEEMAIASGTPVPPVFLLDQEPAINAFAAGYTPGDAVVGLTRGAMENLSREELQGVIAHEFSHILNGDMRMSIRMIGILHGILLLSLIGKLILRSTAFSGRGAYRQRESRNSGNGVLVILACGAILLVIGMVGSVIGGLLKAAVSRQREFLADASAVQFTRNPKGIADALKKLGGLAEHGRLEHPNAAIASHMYFGQGVFEGFSGLMATHPPLEKRIRAIDPGWDGKFPVVKVGSSPRSKRRPRSPSVQRQAVSGFASLGMREDFVNVESVRGTAKRIGDLTFESRRDARALIDALHPSISEAARHPYSARAIIVALLLDSEADIRGQQLSKIEGLVESSIMTLIDRLSPQVDALDDGVRLPLVDLCMPALAAMSKPQYQRFIHAFNALVAADQQIELFEWTLAQVIVRHLRPHFFGVAGQTTRYYGLGRLRSEVSVVLSMMSRVGETRGGEIGHDGIRAAFAAGAAKLSVTVTLLPHDQCTLQSFNAALKKLTRTSVRLRGEIVDACAAAICADNHVRVREAELLRGIADLLDCPVPPLGR